MLKFILLHMSKSELISNASVDRQSGLEFPDLVISFVDIEFVGLGREVTRDFLPWGSSEMFELRHTNSNKVQQSHGRSEQGSELLTAVFYGVRIVRKPALVMTGAGDAILHQSTLGFQDCN